jgi:PAS domain S-box-containing protein
MAKQTVTHAKPWPLRHQAVARLKAGTAPPNVISGVAGVEALTLLHRLAGTAASAGDALKLLHELQVYQVELDLQHEQLEQGRRELTEVLDRYVELYDFAPVGYFTVDSEFKIIEANWTGASLFGVDRDELDGRRIVSFLTPESGQVLLALLKRLRIGGPRETCEVQSGGAAGASRLWQIVANVSPNGERFLITVIDASERKKLDHP